MAFDPAAPVYRRPDPAERLVRCDAVEAAIERVREVARPGVAEVFANALPMTLDTAATLREFEGRPDTFVITGDIPAMWPRDAVNSVWPLLRFVKEDGTARRVVEGVLHRVAACIRHDPYTNAFYDFRFGVSEADRAHPRFGVHADDRTKEVPFVHERKYELDTLASLLRLSAGLFGRWGRAWPSTTTGWRRCGCAWRRSASSRRAATRRSRRTADRRTPSSG